MEAENKVILIIHSGVSKILHMNVIVPNGTTAIVRLPSGSKVYVNKKLLTEKDRNIEELLQKARFTTFKLVSGKYVIKRERPCLITSK